MPEPFLKLCASSIAAFSFSGSLNPDPPPFPGPAMLFSRSKYPENDVIRFFLSFHVHSIELTVRFLEGDAEATCW